MMVLLTTFIMPLAVLGSWTYIRTRERSFYALMLTCYTGMLGVFLALDLFLFYVMWEVMLVPMYFIIGIWGGSNRLYAASSSSSTRWPARCSCSSPSSAMVWKVQSATGLLSFSYDHLLRNASAVGTAALWLFARLLPRVRHQGADVPVPHLAARRARRGADRRLACCWRASCSRSARTASCASPCRSSRRRR